MKNQKILEELLFKVLKLEIFYKLKLQLHSSNIVFCLSLIKIHQLDSFWFRDDKYFGTRKNTRATLMSVSADFYIMVHVIVSFGHLLRESWFFRIRSSFELKTVGKNFTSGHFLVDSSEMRLTGSCVAIGQFLSVKIPTPSSRTILLTFISTGYLF